jgi:lipoyl(octanoyl) transferase
VKSLTVCEYERLEYDKGLELQRRAVELRKAESIGDFLMLVEHTPVITLGRNARRQNVTANPDELVRRGIAVADCDRGGDVTYHGPGQLVGYPIIQLRQCPRPAFLGQDAARPLYSDPLPLVAAAGHLPTASDTLPLRGDRDVSKLLRMGRSEGLGPVEYVRSLEEVLMRAAAEFTVPTRRVKGLTGVWTTAEPWRKLAAIGVHVSRGVTSHGFALNISEDLQAFDTIIPCGIADRGVTSLEGETGTPIARGAVIDAVLRQFSSVFGYQIVRMDNPARLLEPEDTAQAKREPSVV